jgi:DNA-binding HxlR family transcriptional regulator
MKKKKVFVPAQTFKNLISEDTLHILQVLDKHMLSIDQLKKKTKIPSTRLHQQLQKLVESNVIKEKSKNATIHYKLSFKGTSLLHPENSRVMILFTASIITLSLSIGSMFHWATQTVQTREEPRFFLQESDKAVNEPLSLLTTETAQNVHDPLYSWIAIIGIMLFVVLISVTYWRYQKNKAQAL